MAKSKSSRAAQSYAEGFSAFDHATRADVGLPPRHGDQVLRESCDHLPLFDNARGGAEKGKRLLREAQLRCPLGDTAPLSMGHNSSITDNKSVTDKPKPSQTAVRIWKGASRADFPGIQSSNPKLKQSPPPKYVPRGIIETLSNRSRRNLKLKLHTIDCEARAYTMALTLPGNTDGISGAYAKRAFVVLCNRMTASRLPLLKCIGMFWKQELQKRGEVHFHLLLHGVTEESRRPAQQWIAKQWNELLCSRSTPEDRANHLWWHLRDGMRKKDRYNPKADNMQEVRNFAGYFAKYLGKDEKAEIARDPIPGRWWGMVNKKNVPWGEVRELELPARMRIHCQRIARKIRQKKADEAKFHCKMREMGLMCLIGEDKGQPIFSRFFLTCGEGRRGTPQGDNLRQGFGIKDAHIAPVQFPKAIKFAAVKLTGESAAPTAKRILEYARDCYLEDLENSPF